MADRTMSLSAEVATLERKARSESAKLRGQLCARLRIIQA
jgi:hypothetical protein